MYANHEADGISDPATGAHSAPAAGGEVADCPLIKNPTVTTALGPLDPRSFGPQCSTPSITFLHPPVVFF